MSPRIRFRAMIACRSGIHAGHLVAVAAVREEDDDGAWMRLASVTMGAHEVKGRLGVLELAELGAVAREVYDAAGRTAVIGG